MLCVRIHCNLSKTGENFDRKFSKNFSVLLFPYQHDYKRIFANFSSSFLFPTSRKLGAPTSQSVHFTNSKPRYQHHHSFYQSLKEKTISKRPIKMKIAPTETGLYQKKIIKIWIYDWTIMWQTNCNESLSAGWMTYYLLPFFSYDYKAV